VVRATAKVNNEGKDQESDDCDNLDTREDELSFAINLNGKNVQADYE
jgi:hypothetical protein